MIWIGIDAHKRVHQALALSVDGVLGQKTIANTALVGPSCFGGRARGPSVSGLSKVRAHLDAEWPSSSPLVENGCTGSIRDGPLSAGVDCVNLAKATCWTRRQ
jgi:hypothetical protein